MNSFRLDAPLVGFRNWYSRPLDPSASFFGAVHFKPKPLALYPLTSDKQWTKGINTAFCKEGVKTLRIDHDSPHAECQCGLHAYREPGKNHEQEWITDLFDKSLLIRGAILMWGNIFGGEKVIRAEHAEIVGIIDESPTAQQLAEQYKVPCVSEDHLIYLATEHGERVSDDLAMKIEGYTKSLGKEIPPKDLRPTP